MGRKPLSEKRKLSQLRIRLTDTERAELDAAAGDSGTSTWARRVLLKKIRQATKRPAD